MKALLQYASVEEGPYKTCGTLRSKDNHDYKLTKITGEDRLEQPEMLGFEVQLTSLALTLNTDFLNAQQWYFRLIYITELEMIELGQRNYMIDHDGLIARNGIVYHTISLQFVVTDPTQYADYAVPVSLPESESGISLDDNPVYVG